MRTCWGLEMPYRDSDEGPPEPRRRPDPGLAFIDPAVEGHIEDNLRERDEVAKDADSDL